MSKSFFDIRKTWNVNEHVNTHNQAVRIYNTLKSDSAAEAAIRAELSSLTLKMALDQNASFELTSSTINGKSYSGSRTMSNQERMDLLYLIVAMYDRAGAISNQSIPIF